MATLDAWRGALLIEAVGTGKTWIALAVAAREGGALMAIVPAILRAQWADAAARAGIHLHLWTHERASRGTLPAVRPSLVIIDEAHRFRDPATRRTQTIAPWLVGRRTLLLTATPIVNRLADLITLLRLAVPEDSLTLDGIARLGDLECATEPPIALRRIVIRSATQPVALVDRRVTTLATEPAESLRASRAVAAIDALELSHLRPIRRLLTSVLLDAAASSDAAFQQALKRYRALLLQARDSGGATRAMLRRFAGEALDQLVFWPLISRDSAPGDLPLADIERVEQLLQLSTDDEGWLRSLIARSGDEIPTVCFSRHRATARALRIAFGDDAAWVTGAEAGIGPHRVPRDQVLAAFGPDRAHWNARRRAPRILIATDVAAEGLDLQSAGRIVHVDLPWTATRLEQREGRLLRLGQQHADVEVIVRIPAPAIEVALAPQARVRRKRRLAETWLDALQVEDRNIHASPTGPLVTAVTSTRAEDGELTIALERDGRTGVMTVVRPTTGDLASDFARAARTAISRCAVAESGSRALVARIHRLARSAAARRDGTSLQRLDRLLRFATASPTLGMRMIVADLVEGNDRELLRAETPDLPVLGAINARIVAMILRPMAPPGITP